MLQVKNHAEICPVCQGSGKYREYINYATTTNASYERTCHGCGGKGWVTVSEYEEISYHASSVDGQTTLFNMEEAIEKHVPNIM